MAHRQETWKVLAKERGCQREVQRTFKILKEVWLDIGIERIDTYKGVTIKMLLDSGITGMFMNRKTAAKYGFRLQKLERPVKVKNVNGTYNSKEAIMHKVKVNMYYKSHIERMRIDIYNLRRTEVILEMP